MPDLNYPLLLFPAPSNADRDAGHGRGPTIHRPAIGRQRTRIAPKLATLNDAFNARRLTLQQVAPAENPELVLVLETVGPVVNFEKAVARIAGLEWLVEWDEDDIPPDEDFYVTSKATKQLSGRLFMLASNRQALDQLLALWDRYQADPSAKFDTGLAPFRHVFAQLYDIRPWGVTDRLGDDVRAYWQNRLEDNEPTIRFEIEGWYSNLPQTNESARVQIASRVEALGGQVLSRLLIPEIGYHGFLVQLPSPALAGILAGDTPELLLSDRIMFSRPKAQSITTAPDAIEVQLHTVDANVSEGPPVIALLDGLPLQNHPHLAGRLNVDDPDGWEAGYEAKDRVHGTAMASLILHGELDEAAPPLARRIYARPVLRPDPTDTFNSRRREHTPDDVLLIDLIHRAVKRICEGDVGEPAAAPSVRVINLSIGDEARVFDREMSPWARLLDWLAFKYKILFVVSAGNDLQPLTIGVAPGAFGALASEVQSGNAIDALIGNSIHRRILAPAEAINVLTVGALHSDESTFPAVPNRFDLFPVDGLSPVSRIGHGFRRAIKPDILMPGGRALHRERYGGDQASIVLEPVAAAAPPGHKVAVPPMPGEPLNATAYCRGTSNAAALASRAAAQAFDVVEVLRVSSADALPPTRDAVLLKALVAHGASWGSLADGLLSRRPDLTEHAAKKDFLVRWLGYGPIDIGRSLECAAERAMLIGTGEVGVDQARVFSVPLPPSLAGKTVWRRLTITLAWLSPVNPSHRAYRRAKLWTSPPKNELLVKRANSVHDKAALRGTLQHEILEGEAAVAFVDGARLEFKVNCAADAGGLSVPVPFAICVTLEVAAEAGIPIYDEVRARVAPTVQIQQRGE